MPLEMSPASGPNALDGTDPEPGAPVEAPWRWLMGAVSTYRWWALWGLVILALVTLREIGLVIESVEDARERAFGPEVYTRTSNPLDTADLEAALSLWADSGAAAGAVRWHLMIDALLLVPVVGFVLVKLLQAVSPDPTLRALVLPPLAYVVVDEVETWFTFWAFGCGAAGGCTFSSAGTWQLVVLQVFTVAKWLALAVAVLLVVTAWARPDRNGESSLEQAWAQREPAMRTSGLAVLVGLFTLLVALPAGGPLEQIPDVLRGQLEDVIQGDLWQALVAGLALGAFIVCVIIALSLASAPGPAAPGLSGRPAWWWPVVPAVVWGGLLSIPGRVVDGAWRIQPWTLLMVVGAAIIAVGALHFWRALTGPPASEVGTPGGSTLAVGWLAGIVLMAGAVGILRATVPLIADEPIWQEWLALALASAGLVVLPGCLATRVAPWAVDGLLVAPGLRWPRWAALTIAIVVLAAAGRLAWQPGGQLGGTTGAIAWSFAALALVIGVLAWASNRRWWAVSAELGLSGRVPWSGLLVVAWLLASAFDNAGGYHDARVQASTSAASDSASGSGAAVGAAAQDAGTLQASFQAWAKQDFAGCLRRFDDGPAAVPMVFVAASGGGARAAYWTGQALDELFTRVRAGSGVRLLCPGSLLAVSGVSGGSVGLATKLGLPPATEVTTESPTLAALERMTSDGPLAAAAAAMVLRDLPQPFTGARSGWRDRAAVLEDAMAEAAAQAGVEPFEGGTKGLAELGAGWWGDSEGSPVVVLNAASAPDGCLVLASTVAGLPAQGQACAAAPPAQAAGQASEATLGSVAGSLDATSHLGAFDRAGAPKGDSACTVAPATLSAVTAAVLSARFPYVTPSGTLRYCAPTASQGQDPADGQPAEGNTAVVQAVDGGYAERSGLATLLGVWSAVAPLVGQCNAPQQPAAGQEVSADAGCPAANGVPVRVEPYVILMDNSPRSVAIPPPWSREKELWIPPTTSRSTLLSTPVLEQEAAASMGQVSLPDGGSGRYMRLAPQKRVGVQAPLGWVLSDASRAALREEASERVDALAGRIRTAP